MRDNAMYYYYKGQQMTSDLGLEDKLVVRYWIAYEECRYICCSFLYGSYRVKRGDHLV